MAVADLFRARGMTLQLLTSGLALGRFADDIAARFQTVTVSLDGHTDDLYREIRGVHGLGAVVDGVGKRRARAPHIRIAARSTIHRHNFRVLPKLIAKSRDMGLDQIRSSRPTSMPRPTRSTGGPPGAGAGWGPLTGEVAAERRRSGRIRGRRRIH